MVPNDVIIYIYYIYIYLFTEKCIPTPSYIIPTRPRHSQQISPGHTKHVVPLWTSSVATHTPHTLRSVGRSWRWTKERRCEWPNGCLGERFRVLEGSWKDHGSRCFFSFTCLDIWWYLCIILYDIYIYIYIYMCLLGGLQHVFYICIGNNNPNGLWLYHIFRRGWIHRPGVYVYVCMYIYIYLRRHLGYFLFFCFWQVSTTSHTWFWSVYPIYLKISEISRFWSVYPIYLKLSSIFIARCPHCPRCQKLSIFIALIILTLGRGLKTFGCWIWLPVCIQG